MPLYAQQKTAPTTGPRGPFRSLESLEVAIFCCLEEFLLEYPHLDNLPPGPVRFDLFERLGAARVPIEEPAFSVGTRWLSGLWKRARAFRTREPVLAPVKEILVAAVLFTGLRVEVAVLFGEELRLDKELSDRFTKCYTEESTARTTGIAKWIIVGGFMGR